MVHWDGIEPPTRASSVPCSTRLSYQCIFLKNQSLSNKDDSGQFRHRPRQPYDDCPSGCMATHPRILPDMLSPCPSSPTPPISIHFRSGSTVAFRFMTIRGQRKTPSEFPLGVGSEGVLFDPYGVGITCLPFHPPHTRQ